MSSLQESIHSVKGPVWTLLEDGPDDCRILVWTHRFAIERATGKAAETFVKQAIRSRAIKLTEGDNICSSFRVSQRRSQAVYKVRGLYFDLVAAVPMGSC